MGTFYGNYDTRPLMRGSDTYSYEEDFGFCRDDGLLIISPTGTTTDGASIRPKIIWTFMGSPLEGFNKEWSSAHDSLYRKAAVILDANTVDDSVFAFHNWRDIPAKHFVHQTNFMRKFADQTLLQAMKACGEGWLKRRTVYRAVRLFGKGWWS